MTTESPRPDPFALGTEAIRAAMREVPREPIKMERFNPAHPMRHDIEATPAAGNAARFAVLLPTLDFISVRAVLRDWDGVLADLAVLRPDAGQFGSYIFVKYPSDPALITGPEYGRELRAAITTALDALKAGELNNA